MDPLKSARLLEHAGMDVQVKKIDGNWDLGFALHKHSIASVYLGDDNRGQPGFDTKRSEPGEALYRLKYQQDWSQIEPLAAQVQRSLFPLLGEIGLIVPVPASTARPRQPVNELAKALGRLTGIPVFENLIVAAAVTATGLQLKNMTTRAEKDAALAGRFSINPCIANDGRWNALMVDDLFATGATMTAVCRTLRSYPKINRVLAATITWK